MINRNSLNGEWPQVCLGDVVTFLDHLRKPVTAKNREPGPFPYYGANGQQDSVADYIFDEPLVLLAEDGGYFGDPNRNIAYRVGGKCWVNNHAHVLRASEQIDVRFLCRHLERYDVSPFVSGTTRQKLNKAKAATIPIALPPLSEQRRIADILDKADEILRKRQEAISTLLSIPGSAFHEMFGSPSHNIKGWNIGSIRDLVEEVRYGSSSKAGHEGEFPILRMNNITYEGTWDLSDLKYIDLSEKDKRKYLAQRGDILFNRTNSKELVGKTAVFQEEQPMAFAGYLVRARTNKLAHPDYIAGYLNSPHGKATLRHMCKNIVGMANINAQEFQDIAIPHPPIEAQLEYVQVLDGVRKAEGPLRRALCESDDLFRSLVQRAFKGEL